MSNRLQATNTYYQLQATGDYISSGVGCQINICDYLCTRISIFNGNDMIGRINLILREPNYDMGKFIGNIYHLPNGHLIEYVVVSSTYSLRFEEYLDKYIAVVVYPRDLCGGATYIPFNPVITTKEIHEKEQQYREDTARKNHVEYTDGQLLKKKALDVDIEEKTKELPIKSKKKINGPHTLAENELQTICSKHLPTTPLQEANLTKLTTAPTTLDNNTYY